MITVADIKAQRRFDSNAEDALIQTYIDAAYAYLYAVTGCEAGSLDDDLIAGQAVRLIASTWHAVREGETDRRLDAQQVAGVDRLIGQLQSAEYV